MTRKEQITDAACFYAKKNKNNPSPYLDFIEAVEWADRTILERVREYAEAKYDLDYCENVKDILNYLKSLVEE